MALSNYDTLALAFRIREHHDRTLPASIAAEAACNAYVQAQQAAGVDFEVLMEDPRFDALSTAASEASRVLDVQVRANEGGMFDEQSDWGVDIYKNWLYVRSESRHRGDGEGFVEPTLMEIQSGQLRLGRVHVDAVRGPQAGVFVAMYTIDYEGADEDGVHHTTYEGVVGCGVYGYKGEEWVGVDETSLAHLSEHVAGVNPAFANIPFERARRFNQGDQFFAEALEFPTPMSGVGDGDTPIMQQMLDEPEV